MRPKTIILDIDGTIIPHDGSLTQQMRVCKQLPGSLNKLNEWDRKGYNIILMTGRRESMRETTEKQLTELGFFWDQLIMGVGGGERILINDMKSNSEVPTASCINLKRNEGIKDIDI